MDDNVVPLYSVLSSVSNVTWPSLSVKILEYLILEKSLYHIAKKSCPRLLQVTYMIVLGGKNECKVKLLYSLEIYLPSLFFSCYFLRSSISFSFFNYSNTFFIIVDIFSIQKIMYSQSTPSPLCSTLIVINSNGTGCPRRFCSLHLCKFSRSGWIKP